MPKPTPSWNLVRLYAKYVTQTGALKPGAYKVTVPVRVTSAVDDSIIPAGVFEQGSLNTTGAYSLDIMVPATDDPDIVETGLGWKLQVDVTFTDGGAAETFLIDVPYANRPTTDNNGNGLGVDLRTRDRVSGSAITQAVIDTTATQLTSLVNSVRNVTDPTMRNALGNSFSAINPAAHVVANAGGSQTVPVPSSTMGQVHQYGLTAATCAFTLPTGVKDINGNPAQVDVALYLVNSGGGARAFTVPSSVSWDINGKPAISSTAGVTTVVTFTSLDGGATYFGSGPATSATTAYTDEQAQDAAAGLLAAGSHSGITFTYDDTGNRINATVAAQGGSGGTDLVWSPADNGLVAANMHPGALQSSTVMIANRDYAMKVRVRGGKAISGFVLPVGIGGSTDTAGFYAALYNSAGARVAQATTDFGASLRIVGNTLVSFAAPWTPTTDGYAYLVLHAGTGTALPRPLASAAASVMNIGLTATTAGDTAPRFSVASNTWTGATAPATLGTLSTPGAITYFAGLV